MARIAGIAQAGRIREVQAMLDRMAPHGGRVCDVFEVSGVTMGAVAPAHQTTAISRPHGAVRDYVGYGHYAQAQFIQNQLVLMRDPLGVAPLYHGRTSEGVVCFASEVKALLTQTDTIVEIPPGTLYDGRRAAPHYQLHPHTPLGATAEELATELSMRLVQALEKVVQPDIFGAWLSGGLDSSALVALARPRTARLHTFAGGLAGAADLAYARAVAEFVGSIHHEVVLSESDLLRTLPTVIYHLESFDALLVRSSIVNFAVAREAAAFVPAVLSGEGGDELFAGYEYLKGIPRQRLEAELRDITARLHNTALQRVDRCAAAHGLIAHTTFLDPAVLDFALQVPVEYKLRGAVEKWILREALHGMLPDDVLNRPKAKFWQGSGVEARLAAHAEKTITDADFRNESRLPNGWVLDSKEELLYYRHFRERFGTLNDLQWMGRTKRASEV